MHRRIRYALLALIFAFAAVASPAAAGIFSKVTFGAVQPLFPEHVGMALLGAGLIVVGQLSRRRA